MESWIEMIVGALAVGVVYGGFFTIKGWIEKRGEKKFQQKIRENLPK